MKTLIELYDERPLENVLSTEVFRPERTVFLCPPEVAGNRELQGKLREYFRHRGVACECAFLSVSLLDAEAVAKRLGEVIEGYDDCALDIAGGTDAALFAGGLVCAERDIPVFTYSRRRNMFFDIRRADFARDLPCPVRLKVEDTFLMAGGSMRRGRVDNAILSRYLNVIEPLFGIYLKHRREWPKAITYIQRVSQNEGLDAQGDYIVKGEHGKTVAAPMGALEELEGAGLIHGLKASPEGKISFAFADAQVRAWLRDVGSALELYVYKACLGLGVFDDVVTSAVVDWQGRPPGPDSVTNEIDVMATSGVKPFFISCKTCAAHTEALNELAILRDRFGGEVARAAIVTAERGRGPMRSRAMELGIDVIDLDDLSSMDALQARLRALLR